LDYLSVYNQPTKFCVSKPWLEARTETSVDVIYYQFSVMLTIDHGVKIQASLPRQEISLSMTRKYWKSSLSRRKKNNNGV
jgi:hypothetical protein